ncbi:MAG: hypothetical protein A2Y40_09625 [Candidatus Margulisbacteria bacterium GWF2_35_9]|nr:MAG: hypothetical protein A2Y40_09625 [Candidatus Margulisbacteria bacterium GWF2_35_9]
MRFKLISNRQELELKKINDCFAFANEAYRVFSDEVKVLDPRVFESHPNMDSLLANLEMDKKGDPLKIHFVQSLNLWLFGEHRFFYICLRLQQLMDMAPTENLSLINWDQHEDFNPIRGFELFIDAGKPDEFENILSVENIIPMLYHQYQSVGIASYVYPFIWDGSLKNMMWRRNSKVALNGVSQHTYNFNFNPKINIYEFNRTYNVDRQLEFYDLVRTKRSNFKKLLTELSPTHFLHTLDMDSFYVTFKNLVSKTRMNIFKQDLGLIETMPEVYPKGIFVATTPGDYTNPRTIQALTREVLSYYKSLETALSQQENTDMQLMSEGR